MSTRLADKVAIVTGAGRGLGRAHAVLLASEGAQVVVNDVGGRADGEGADATPAREVVEEITAAGGEAVVDNNDISTTEGAEGLISSAVDAFGKLDVLVNNAGILRDRMLFNMTDEEWDAVIRVHLRGTFGPSRIAAKMWREKHRAGEEVDGRIINTSSAAGLYGQKGQTNYGAAKAGIAAFTVIAAMELERYGITVNAVAPAAVTRLTEHLMPDDQKEWRAEHVAPIVAWLSSPAAKGVTGRVFNSGGGLLSLAEPWHAGPEVEADGTWALDDLDEVVPGLLERSAGQPDMMGRLGSTESAE